MKTATRHFTPACTIKEKTSTSELLVSLSWTVTSRPIRCMVFTYLNWWDMLGFVHESCTLCAYSVTFPPVFKNKASNLPYSSNQFIKFFNVIVQQCSSWLKSIVAHQCILCLLGINGFIFLVCNASYQITQFFRIHSLSGYRRARTFPSVTDARAFCSFSWLVHLVRHLTV